MSCDWLCWLVEAKEPDSATAPARYEFEFNENDPILFAQAVMHWAENCTPGKEAAFFDLVIRAAVALTKRKAGRPKGSVKPPTDEEVELVARWKASGLTAYKFTEGDDTKRHELERAIEKLDRK